MYIDNRMGVGIQVQTLSESLNVSFYVVVLVVHTPVTHWEWDSLPVMSISSQNALEFRILYVHSFE